MKTFQCTCTEQPIIFFESHQCLSCGKTVGIDDSFERVETYQQDVDTGFYFKENQPDTPYKKCDNNERYSTCNGMVNLNAFVPDPAIEESKQEMLCFGCRFNETVPNLSIVEHIPLWEKMEAAKRRALYTLKVLPIPLQTTDENPEAGLSFDFITDRNVKDHFTTPIEGQNVVFTGHDCGHITINLAEADDVARYQTKHDMGERYRTLLGHFRHELGHYYFDQLIVPFPEKHALCKQYFGDDALDYQEALKYHYEHGAPQNWRDTFISEYATMHPYEDWAETWAHYMHIIDTLETAQNFSITGSTFGIEGEIKDLGDLSLPQDNTYFLGQTDINSILDTWMEFSVMLNSLNRSMGLADAYPFVLTLAVRTKLAFIHHAIHNQLDVLPELT